MGASAAVASKKQWLSDAERWVLSDRQRFRWRLNYPDFW
jgi:hypothetical protein